MKKWTIGLFVLLTSAGLVYYFFPEDKLPTDSTIDEIIVYKKQMTMEGYSKGQLLKTYHISLGKSPTGDKEFEGDKKTPEGEYFINDKNPNSGFYKNLGVSYPNSVDKEEAKLKGLNPGGEIKIHGLRNGVGFIGKFHRLFNWTAGCIAVTDIEIDELYDHVDIGARITIRP
jgi:murein L,D-transpeptidase YafK